jgi:serine/threonine protein kinase
VLKKELGCGSFGCVYLVEKKSSISEQKMKDWVIKIIDISKKGTNNYEERLKSLQRDLSVGTIVAQKSTFLMKYIETFEDSGYFCIVMEYCSEGDLQLLLDKKYEFTQKVFFYFFFFYFI